jgi:hydroxymethylpyrimidine pyrophosphatase-like HAD family hydrolase
MKRPEIDSTFNAYDHIYQINIFTQDDLPEAIIQSSPFDFLRASFNGYDVIEGILYKEAGIVALKELWQLNDDQIVAIGDGMNDIGMIKYAPLGIAMGNAQDAVKKAADYVTDTVINDGLSKALKHFNFI